MQYQAAPTARHFAPVLRQGMTDSEQRLWYALRAEQLGYKFRRQHPLGHYIADFACLQPRLIVELDGSQHAAQHHYDAERDAFFSGQGFGVLRFPSNAVFQNLEGVLTQIQQRLQALDQPLPQPSPKGGGGLNPSL